MNNPKITVIIVYNNEENLYDCIQSSIQQTFSNIEVICVNNGAKDNAEKIASEQAEKIERIKLISMPNGVEAEVAKKAGLAVANGEFVIFIENNEVVSADFLKNAYIQMQSENKIELKDKYLYRRTFIEHDREISALVEDKIKSELSLYSDFIEEQKKKIREEFDAFNKNNVENIKNSTYEILTRFNALEKEAYYKAEQTQETIKFVENSINANTDEKINSVYADIQKVYDYINTNIEKKNNEIQNIYNDISQNYKYVDEIFEKKGECFDEKIEKEKTELMNKIKELEQDIALRYVNLKRMMDLK